MSCEPRLIPTFNVLAQRPAWEQGEPGRVWAIGLLQRLILTGLVRHFSVSGRGFMMVCLCSAGGLGISYIQGRGVKPNLSEAYVWLSLASDNGSSDAGELSHNIEGWLPQKELETSRSRISLMWKEFDCG